MRDATGAIDSENYAGSSAGLTGKFGELACSASARAIFDTHNITWSNLFLTCAYYQKYYALAGNVSDVSPHPDRYGLGTGDNNPVPNTLKSLMIQDVGMHPLIDAKTGTFSYQRNQFI